MDGPQLEELASHAYQGFCESAEAFLPAYRPDWSQLPSCVREAWKAAAAAVIRNAPKI
jgi:hypothetical protein